MRRFLLALTVLVLGTAAPLHAAEGGLLNVNTGLMVWTIIIFSIVLFVLSKFAFPKILGAVEAREAHLRETIEAAERDRAEAARLVDENRRELEATRARSHEAMVEARNAAERMRDDMLVQTRREQEELMVRARHDIEMQRESALESVRHDAVELSIAAAERLIRRNLGDADNRRLVLDYLGQVEGRPAAAPVGV